MRIGQKEYYVSSVCSERDIKEGNFRTAAIQIDKIIGNARRIRASDQPQEGECKYCMMEEGYEDG